MSNWDRVDELQDEIGADGFAEVIALFLDEADEVVARLSPVGDPGLEADLHFLKGSALNLGLATLADLCHAGERAAARGQSAEVDLAEVRAVYAQSRERLLSGLEARSAA